MGCGASQEIYIDGIAVPNSEPGYPPPKPPKGSKAEVFRQEEYTSIETRAKQAPASLMSSYTLLINYLTQDTQDDLQKVRAIYCWLAAQSIYTMKFSKGLKDAHSPEGYMKTIQQDNGNYPSFFALLCRAAQIPCVIISGRGKAVQYEVGQQDVSDMYSRWTAVYVRGSWRLIHIYWALVGVTDFSKGKWTRVEEDGKAVREKEKASSGTRVTGQDDFWFLTDPDKFIYFCRADGAEWQLLKSPWTMDKFVNVPHFSENYFTSGFKLVSQHAAILHSQKGECTITFQHLDTANAIQLSYVLLFDNENSEETIDSSLQLNRYVIPFNAGNPKDKSLRVRFPNRGIYKVKVTGTATFTTLLASFRLECHEVLKNVQPYPINPKIGFGYNTLTEDTGLIKPSQKSGILIVQQKQIVKFKFSYTRKLDLQTLLVHKDKPAEELASHVTQDQSKEDVTITVNVPEHAQNPEYALQVNARAEGSKAKYENVVNYLLTHDQQEVEDSDKGKNSTEDAKGMELRQELLAATASNDIQRLEAALRACKRAQFSDKENLTKARLRLLALHEEALQAAMDARILKGLESAIEAAKASVVAPELEKGVKMRDARSLRDRLRRLAYYMSDILAMKQATVSEIHRYQRPRTPVHTVMTATFLLLGEKEQQLKKWDTVRALLRRQGQTSIIRRVKQFDLQHLKLSTVQRADDLLIKYDKDSVRQVSAGAGTFYVWSSNIINEGKAQAAETAK